MLKIKLFLSILVLAFALFISARDVSASEGTFELVSTRNDAIRCYASSVLMTDYTYKILVSCRDLVYPPASDAFSYILWANPAKGDKPIKLGPLGFGKAEFLTRPSFTSLYVTIERNPDTDAPSQNVVMKGEGKAIRLLENTEELPALIEKAKETTKPIATPQPKKTGISSILGASLISIVAITALISLVLFLTRRK